jgi:adenosylcobinamide-GDP ribazoletransferase
MRRALAFLTPLGGAATPTPRTLDWFPAVGALVGIAVGGIWWAAGRVWPPIVVGAVAVVADAALTGCLHLDGLADAADGLLPPIERQRRLEVMRDPSVGAFGAVTLVVVLVLRFAAFAATPSRALVIAGLWCGSRTAMAVIARSLPYARPGGGLATAFVDASAPTQAPGASEGTRRWTRTAALSAVLGLALALALTLIGCGPRGVVVLGAGAVGAAGVAWLAKRRIGGFTGDVLGAAAVIGETAGLLVLAAR